MTPRRSRIAVFALAAALTATTLAGCATDTFAQNYSADADSGYVAGDGSWQVIPAGQRAEPVQFSGVDETGATHSNETIAGKVAVVNFWYAACPPCRAEAKDLEAVHQEFTAQGVQFLGVNVYDQAATITSFNEEFGVTYPSILDVQEATVRLAFSDNVPPQAIPSTLVLDAKGSVAAIIRGVADPSVLRTMINDVLAESK